MRNWLTYIFLLSTLISFGQNKLITGSVLIDEGNEYVSTTAGIRVENLRSEARTFTTPSGYYSIQASIGDTILFEADFLIPRKIVINQNIYTKGYLQAHLNIETIELGTAVIGNNKFGKNFGYDSKTELYDKMGLDQRLRDLEPKRDLAKFKPMDVLNPVRLIGHMNGFYRDQRKIRNYETKASLIKELKHYYPLNYFTDDLHLPEYKIEEFLYYVSDRYPLKEKVINRQFEVIQIELEAFAKQYLKELNQAGTQ